jgi:hypothetical protein
MVGVAAVLTSASRQQGTTTELTNVQGITSLKKLKRQYPGAVVTLVLTLAWMIFLGSRTFGYLRSHFEPVLVGVGASAALGWLITRMILRRWF